MPSRSPVWCSNRTGKASDSCWGDEAESGNSGNSGGVGLLDSAMVGIFFSPQPQIRKATAVVIPNASKQHRLEWVVALILVLE
jgi:hypothetical protein